MGRPILDSSMQTYKVISPRRHILPCDLGPHRRLLHPIVLAHAGEHGKQRPVRLLGGKAELGELLAMRILDILSLRQHRADDRRHVDHRLQSFLDRQALDHAVLRTVLAHIREIRQQEGVPHRRWSQRHDILALAFFEAQDQIGVRGHLAGQSPRTEAARLDAHAIHHAGAGRVDLMHWQTMRAGARDLYRGSLKITGQQQFAHRRATDIARADEHDMHSQSSFTSLNTTLWACPYLSLRYHPTLARGNILFDGPEHRSGVCFEPPPNQCAHDRVEKFKSEQRITSVEHDEIYGQTSLRYTHHRVE